MACMIIKLRANNMNSMIHIINTFLHECVYTTQKLLLLNMTFKINKYISKYCIQLFISTNDFIIENN